MLELCHAKTEILDLLAPRESSSRESALDRLVAPRPELVCLGAPRGDGVADGATHRGAIDAHPTGEVVCDLVRRLEPEARPADPGEQELGDRPRVVVLGRRAHVLSLRVLYSGVATAAA